MHSSGVADAREEKAGFVPPDSPQSETSTRAILEAPTGPPVPVDTASRQTQPGALRAILIVAGGAGCFMLAHQATFPTLPVLMSLRGASESDIAIVIGAIGILAIGFRPIVGFLIDNWGRRRTQTLGLITLAGVALGYAYSTALFHFGLFRSIQSTAVGGTNTTVSTYVSDVAPSARRAEFLGYLNAIQTTATALGPTLGFALLGLPAMTNVPLPGPWTELGALGGFNFAALFAFMIGVTLLGALLTLFAPESNQQGGRRFTWKHLFYRGALVPMLVMVMLITPFAGVITYMPFYATDKGLENAGLYFTFQAIGILIAGLTLGRLTDSVGRRTVVTLCMIAMCVAMIILSAALGPWMVLGAGLLGGVAQGGARNGIAAWTADVAPQNERGAALSTTNMGFDVGVTVGAFMLAAIVPQTGIGGGFFISAFAPLLGALIAAVFLRDRMPR